MVLANAKPNALAIAALGLKEGECLLELGCGPGRALHESLRSTQLGRAIGLDWSETMLAQSRHRNRRALGAGRLALVRAEFSHLPFADEIVDAVLAVNVIYFMKNSAALREVRRVLRPGGRVILYATDKSVMRHWPFAGRHTHRLCDRRRLTALLVDAGFAADRIRIEAVDGGLGVMGLLATAHKET